MKKQLFTLAAAFASVITSAQSIPNGNFENWNSATIENPQFFMCANEESHGGGYAPVNVFKTADAYHGNYAIQLNTIQFGTDTVGGWVANGNPGANNGGIPYSQTPTGIRLYYKATIMPNDSALVLVIFKKAGSAIGQYLYKISASQSNYTLFSQTFSPALSQTPDTVIFASAAGNLMVNKGVPGTMMQLDSVSFTGVASQPVNFNGSFELWQNLSRSTLLEWNGAGLIQTTDKYAGTYAVELITNPPGFGNSQPEVGRMHTGKDVNNGPPVGGYPFSNMIDTMVFYYKYLPANYPLSTDSGRMTMSFSNNGVNIWGYQKLVPYALNYTKVEIPFDMTMMGTPDSVIISFESSNWPVQNSYIGSDLKVDQVYFKSQTVPISLFSMPLSGCKGVPIQLTDSSQNMPISWQWFMTGASPANSTLQNPVITYTNTGTFTVSLQASNSFGNGSFESKTITIYNNPTVVASSATICAGSPAIITAGGANTYAWSNAATGATVTVTPSATTVYTVTGTSSQGCSATATSTVLVPVPVTPSICMVTVDSLTDNNIIYWDKSLYNNVDTFIVYREVSTNTYLRVGSTSVDSLSQFMDTDRTIGPANGDPSIGSYRYKLQIRDTCGAYGTLSLYHNTVKITDQQNGNFQWNTYDVEGQATPVANFILERDNANTGVWTTVGIVSGTQTSLFDASYGTYQTIANWRVQATGFNCAPTARFENNSAQAAVVKSKSNITNNRTTGIKNSEKQFSIYPNPSKGVLNIASDREIGLISVYNQLGEVVLQEQVSGSTGQIDLNNLPAGIYILRHADTFTKLVKQ